MTRKKATKAGLVGICIVVLSMAAVAGEDELFQELAELDTALFKAGFDCDTKVFDRLVAQDLEFYHDQASTTHGREAFKQSIERLCANYGRLHRELVKGSMQVYPMFDGAVQMGLHRFFVKRDGEIVPTSIAKFIHLWKKTEEGWQLARVISYDHQPLEP